jgi:hypothetical protein
LAAKSGSDAPNLRIDTGGVLRSEGERGKSPVELGIGKLEFGVGMAGCVAAFQSGHCPLNVGSDVPKLSVGTPDAGEKLVYFGTGKLFCVLDGAILLSIGST